MREPNPRIMIHEKEDVKSLSETYLINYHPAIIFYDDIANLWDILIFQTHSMGGRTILVLLLPTLKQIYWTKRTKTFD